MEEEIITTMLVHLLFYTIYAFIITIILGFIGERMLSIQNKHFTFSLIFLYVIISMLISNILLIITEMALGLYFVGLEDVLKAGVFMYLMNELKIKNNMALKLSIVYFVIIQFIIPYSAYAISYFMNIV